MNKVSKFFTLFLVLLITGSVKGQDVQFTQFYAAPLTLNPALTGAFAGKFRVASIYRDQWRNALDNPYVSFAASMDLRFGIGKFGSNRKDAAGVGIMFFSDKVSGFDFNTNQIAVSGAYHKALDRKKTQYLSLGFQGSIVQRGLTYDDITFRDQFNGTTGYTDITAELLPENTFSYADFSTGINYSYSAPDRASFFIGLAMHHILQPDVSFFKSENTEDNTFFPSNPLMIRYSAHISAALPVADKIQLLPRATVSVQGPHFVSNAGLTLRFLLSEYDGTALHIGGWARPVQGIDNNLTIDSVIGLVGIEISNVLIGFSYDANLNALTSSGRTGRGSFEVSVAYLGEYQNETVICPKF
jgi:type IX secretion system PorP/SprF family membrane protein